MEVKKKLKLVLIDQMSQISVKSMLEDDEILGTMYENGEITYGDIEDMIKEIKKEAKERI